MTDEMEYMSISQYCLNLIKNNLKMFLETKYKSLIEEEYKSSDESYYDVMFYFAVFKKYLNEINEIPKVIINTIYNIKNFRNKIAHQVPINLREFYRFVDDTQIILELINICDKNELIKIENTRKEIIKRMSDLDDNQIIIGSSFNAGNNGNYVKDNLNIKKFESESDIEMGDYIDFDIPINKKENSINNNNYNIITNGKNYNDFLNKDNINTNQINNQINFNINNNIDIKERERMKKINDNFNLIMNNSDQKNFMKVKKVDFSNI